MPRLPDELEELGFDESPEVGPDDTVLYEGRDGATQELIVLVEVEIDGAAYAVLATHEQLSNDLDGDLMVACVVETSEGRRCRPIEDESALEVVRAALADLLDVHDGPAAPEA